MSRVAPPCALHPRRRARQRKLEAAYLRLPGTANTSRPCSPAKRAVISEPERSAASTTTTPSEIPEIRRLQRGKSFPRGEKPGARSLMRSPCSPIERCSSSLSMPPASTATVPRGRAARGAAVSMPRASPEAMTKPSCPSIGKTLTMAQTRRRLRGRRGLVLAFANARLLASHEPADIVGVANIKKNREQQEQRSESPLPRQREHA